MKTGRSVRTSFGKSTLRAALFGACLAPDVSSALEIRTYSAERHDRFTGYPSAPAFNDSAYYGSRKFTGVAWVPGEGNSRQYALVSPKHVVFAKHHVSGVGTTLRFLGSNGMTTDRTIADIQYVLNGASLPTDLCLVTLSSPLTSAEGVSHFPYLNLADEQAYLSSTLTVFGWEVKAGRGTVYGFDDSLVTGVNTTRMMGWIAETEGPQDWVFRRANLAAGSVSEFHVSWNAVRVATTIPVEVSRVADGSPAASQTFHLSVAPTFKAWAAGLDDETQAGDPDHDGVSNLLEYAFGGDPESGAMVSESGGNLLPVVMIESGQAVVRFPIRDDAVSRGITYVPEFSEALENWSSVDVPVLTDGTGAYVPAVSGFLLRTLSWSATDPRRFCRIRVTVSE